MQTGCHFSHRNLYPISESNLHAAIQVDRHSVNRRVPDFRRENHDRLVIRQYSVPEGFNFPALSLAPGAFRVNVLDPIRRFVEALRQAVVLSVILCLVESGAGVLAHGLSDQFGYILSRRFPRLPAAGRKVPR